MVDEEMEGCLTSLTIKEILLKTVECRFSQILRNLIKILRIRVSKRMGTLIHEGPRELMGATLPRGILTIRVRSLKDVHTVSDIAVRISEIYLINVL